MDKLKRPMTSSNPVSKTGHQVSRAGSEASLAGKQITKFAGNKTQTYTFGSIPASEGELMSLPEATMETPFNTAALFVLALNTYAVNKGEGLAMLNALRGPAQPPMGGSDLELLKSQIANMPYLPRSYFVGATPQNDYTPPTPYTVTVSDNTYSYEGGGAIMYVQCGGADSPRPVSTRLAKDGRWYLIGFSSALSGIKKLESSNPWA